MLITLQTWQGWRAGRRRWSRRRRCRSTRRGREGAWRRKAQEAASLASWDENIWNDMFLLMRPFLWPWCWLKEGLKTTPTCKGCWCQESWKGSRSQRPSPARRWSTDPRSPGLPSETEQAVSNVSNVWIRSFQMSKSSYIQQYRSLCRDWKEHSGIYRQSNSSSSKQILTRDKATANPNTTTKPLR